MDPVSMLSLAMTAGGLATSLFGSAKASTASSAYYQTQQNVAGLEAKVNDQRKAAMEVDARRRQLETVRNNQRARAMAETSATASGAQFGSGLQGAYGGIGGQSETNLLGVNQNLEIGRNIFGLDTQISQQRIAASGYESQRSTDQGISALGNQIMGSSSKIAGMLPGFGGGNNPFSMMTNGPFGVGS
jgi:cell division protein FtsL